MKNLLILVYSKPVTVLKFPHLQLHCGWTVFIPSQPPALRIGCTLEVRRRVSFGQHRKKLWPEHRLSWLTTQRFFQICDAVCLWMSGAAVCVRSSRDVSEQMLCTLVYSWACFVMHVADCILLCVCWACFVVCVCDWPYLVTWACALSPWSQEHWRSPSSLELRAY